MTVTGSERVYRALELIAQYGQIEGDHHRAWTIDQVTRILTGPLYDSWIESYCSGEDGPHTFGWDTGIAP